jgi:hypothetical protein
MFEAGKPSLIPMYSVTLVLELLTQPVDNNKCSVVVLVSRMYATIQYISLLFAQPFFASYG